jgi:hypothetical protein
MHINSKALKTYISFSLFPFFIKKFTEISVDTWYSDIRVTILNESLF